MNDFGVPISPRAHPLVGFQRFPATGISDWSETLGWARLISLSLNLPEFCSTDAPTGLLARCFPIGEMEQVRSTTGIREFFAYSTSSSQGQHLVKRQIVGTNLSKTFYPFTWLELWYYLLLFSSSPFLTMLSSTAIAASAKNEDMIEQHFQEIEHKDHAGSLDSENDPHDPLNWSGLRKLSILAVIGVFIFLGTGNMIIVGPALQIIPKELNSSFDTSTYLVGGPLLAYGVASFFWVPIANRYGARLVFVSSAMVAGCLCIWAAKATTFGSLVAARTLASAFFAPPETLAPQMIGDVFHLKDRAKAMTFIVIMQGSGFPGGPLIGSFIINDR